MCVCVSLEVVHEGVVLAAVGVAVRPQAAVEPLVRLQAALLGEPLPADAAGVRPLARVCAQVDGQVRGPEVLVAD